MTLRLTLTLSMIGCLWQGMCLAESPATARPQPAVKSAVKSAAQASQQRLRIPATGYEVVVGTGGAPAQGVRPTQALLGAIATWLAAEFGLPKGVEPPAIKLLSPRKITALRYTGIALDDPSIMADVPRGQRETVATYDRYERVILLPERWTRSTAAELSVLVHEMVHHLQHAGGLRYECPQASEKLAYDAQEKWLRLFGRSLAADFEVDGFTLLATTQCLY